MINNTNTVVLVPELTVLSIVMIVSFVILVNVLLRIGALSIAGCSVMLIRSCSMMFDYSCCDFCPYDAEYSTYFGNVCESCQAIKAERALFSRMADFDDEDFYG